MAGREQCDRCASLILLTILYIEREKGARELTVALYWLAWARRYPLLNSLINFAFLPKDKKNLLLLDERLRFRKRR